MKNQMTSRDYELISAYLDNQLSEKDRAYFEIRLKADPELSKELSEIDRTRKLIHSLPKLRAPRNYYIKAESVPIRPALRLAPVFGIVSAVASILLALVIFGSTFFKSRQPVAMAPVAAPQIQETHTVLQESQRSAASTAPTTEAPPMVFMTAPLENTPTSPAAPTETSPTQPATPTTIYLFAYPPSTTPQGVGIMSEEQTEASQIQCEQWYGGSAYPTLTTQFDCPTPTATLTTTPTPTDTSTPTPPALLSIQATTPTPTETATETPTGTATPTETPTSTLTPTFSPSPSPTEVPPVSEKVVPTSEAASPAGLTAPNAPAGAGATSPSAQDQGTGNVLNPNASFLNYLLLAAEISLASIAVIAGVVAILLRIRVGR